MFSLATISKMNSIRESHKARARAVALNNPGGHPKSAEKGQADHHFIDPLKTKLGGVDKRKFVRISSVAH